MRRPAVRRAARRVRTLSRRVLRPERLKARQLLAGDPILINFQLGGTPVPAGYFADTGLVYANRGNGYSYGWNLDHTDFARDRDALADQRLDTLIHFHAGGLWEIGVPAGLYDVKVSIGDATSTSINTLNVEGNEFWDAEGLLANQFLNDTQVVNITDGRLTLDQGNLPDKSTKINYIEIVPLDDGPNTPPNTPVITEANVDGKIVNPEDVHMEAPNFSDPDGDLHSCTNWEIYTTGPAPELAWVTPCIGGVEKVHTHQGDGIFANAHAGRTSFFPNTDFELRVRYRDNRGAFSGPTPLVEYSGSGKGSVIAMAAGPDGIYFSEFYKDQDYVTPIDRGARIFRVRFVGGADFEADITTGTPNLAVRFTDTSNMADITSWLWDFGDGPRRAPSECSKAH